MYKVLLERRAEEDLDALGNSSRKRIVERLFELKKNPYPPDTKKLKGLKNAWRIRIGDYRILYELNDKKKETKIYRIRLPRHGHGILIHFIHRTGKKPVGVPIFLIR